MAKNTPSKPTVEQQTDTKKREEALSAALKKIEKNYGKGAVMKLGEKTDMNIEVIPTGSIILDNALGVQGYPKGRIIEIYGPESSGKTTVALHAIAEAQKLGIQAAFIDAEHALDPQYAQNLGVNIDELLLSQPDTGEQGLEITDALVRSGAIGMIVIDSVAALVPRSEIDGEMGDSHVGLQARLMSQALRKLSATINGQKCVVIFINQLREKVGVMFGNPEITPGGRALKFYSTIRLDVRRGEQIKDTKNKMTTVYGNKTKIKVAKNKVAPPFKVAEVELMYGEGLSHTAELVTLGEETEIIKKSGAWFDYNNGVLKVQGREAMKQALKDNSEIMSEIEEKIRKKLRGEEIDDEQANEEFGAARIDLDSQEQDLFENE
jgi:recombination protein RecA